MLHQHLGLPLTWRPLLAGDERAAALARVREIANDLPPLIGAYEFPSVSGGLGSFPVFYAYLDDACPGEGYGDRAAALLERTVARASRAPLYGLFGGCTGVGWLCDHLAAPDDEDDPNRGIDELLVDALAKPWTDHYDLINGLVGIGVYALERRGRGAGPAILARVVEQLAALATTRDDGITWHTPPRFLPEWQRRAYPDGHYNLGLAHGVPGVVGLLSRALAAGVRAPELLDGAGRWLAAQAQDGADARYGACLTDDEREPVTRSAWCYGDPGIAVTFVAAGLAGEQPRWIELGIELARGVARRSHDAAGCVDASVCHGTAGLAHQLNRIYQVTGDEELAAAARRWYRETLALRMGGAGGFREAPSPRRETPELGHESIGLLSGPIGVGLALLAATTDTAPDWDRFLLLDLGQ